MTGYAVFFWLLLKKRQVVKLDLAPFLWFFFSECVLCASQELPSYKDYQFLIWVAPLLKPWGSKLNVVAMMPAFQLVLFRWCIFCDVDQWGLGQLATFCDWIWFQTTNYHDWKDKLKIPTSRDFGIEKLNLSVLCSVQCGEFEFLAFLLPGDQSWP